MHYENFYCNLKRNETMGKKPDRNRALPQNLCLLDSMSVFHPISRRPTPPHTHLTPASSTLPIYVLLTQNMRAEDEGPSQHPPPRFPCSFNPQRSTSTPSSTSTSSSITILMAQKFSFPDLSRLSCTSESSCRPPPRSSISAVLHFSD